MTSKSEENLIKNQSRIFSFVVKNWRDFLLRQASPLSPNGRSPTSSRSNVRILLLQQKELFLQNSRNDMIYRLYKS